MRTKSLYITFLLMSLLCSCFLLGIENIKLTSTGWLLNGSDMSSQQVGWYFFLNDVWRFPLGSNPNFGEGLNNSIIYSDSIPLFALIFKSIGFLIAKNFQYFSLWFTICFFFQLFFSYKILFNFTKNYYGSLVGSLFFLFAPIFIYRLGLHPALAGQWLILFALYLGTTKELKNSFISWIFLISLSSLIHFHFTIVILTLYIFLSLFAWIKKKQTFSNLFKNFTVILAVLFLIMYVAGYFEIRSADTLALGFGSYKLNLLSPFDPYNSNNNISWSWFMPDILLAAEEEHEGFNYLGLGVILMVLFSFSISFLKRFETNIGEIKRNEKIKLFFWISIFLTAIALSNKISLGTYTLIEIPLNKFLLATLSIIRSSGRFFWTTYYFVMLVSLIIILISLKNKKSIFIISVFFIIQIADISSGLKKYMYPSAFFEEKQNLNDPIWTVFSKKFSNLKTTYPINYSNKFDLFSGYILNSSVKETNIVKLARVNRKLSAENRYKLYKRFNSKDLSINTLYIIENSGHLRNLKKLFNNMDVGFFYRDEIWSMALHQKKLMNKSDKESFDKIKPQILEIGKKNDVTFNNNNDYFGFGWSHNFNRQGIWSEGKLSTILFSIKPDKDDKMLKIDCEPYLTNNKNLTIDVFVNDTLNQNLIFNKKNNSKNQKIHIRLDNKFINNQDIKIDFNIKNPTAPLDVFESPDSRKLGILLKSIELIKI